MRCVYHITFVPPAPLPEAVVAHLSRVTGLALVHTPERLSITCLENDMEVIVDAYDAVYALNKFNPTFDYLLGSALFSLIALGGTTEVAPPWWAGQKWRDVQHHFGKHYEPITRW